MAHRGKSINLFLMDGAANGRIRATLSNWTGIAYKVPRTVLDECRTREDFSQSGVYFLFGIDDDTNADIVYVGQAGMRSNGAGILSRLQEHKHNPGKDYWTEAVVFTTSNNSLGPTEISYLENRFTKLAKKANRYPVKNANDPSMGNPTEEKVSELEEFIDYAVLVMGALGYRVFDPSIASAQPIDSGTDIPSKRALYIHNANCDVTCEVTGERFLVLAGSRIRPQETSGAVPWIRNMRDTHAASIDELGVIMENLL